MTFAGSPGEVETKRSFVNGSTSMPNGPGAIMGGITSVSSPNPHANTVSIGSVVPRVGTWSDSRNARPVGF
jgi:hypothetical protein